jgi:hypothetical protein
MQLLHGDELIAGVGRLDPAGLAGRWINTNEHGNGVQELIIDVDPDAVALRAMSIGRGWPCAWGVTRADLLCGSDPSARTAMSFTARYDFGAHQVELQGNLNLGLLVVASFNRIGADGYDYFAREFYRSGDRATAPAATPWSTGAGRVGGDDPQETVRAVPGLSFDGSEIFGGWWNTNPNSKGITRLRIDANARNGAIVRLWGADAPVPTEWGAVQAELFALSSGSRLAKAFSARYRADGFAITLQANIKQGVLVVASFTEFDDDDRSDYFHREFYYRA